MRPSAERALVGVVLAISFVTLGLQVFVLRPHLWPAGAGLALSGESLARLAPPSPVSVIRPPDAREAVAGDPVTVVRVVPGGEAERAGIRDGDRAAAITLNSCAFDQCPDLKFQSMLIPLDGQPRTPEAALREWRALQAMSGFVSVVGADGVMHNVTFDRPAIWSMDDAPWGAW